MSFSSREHRQIKYMLPIWRDQFGELFVCLPGLHLSNYGPTFNAAMTSQSEHMQPGTKIIER